MSNANQNPTNTPSNGSISGAAGGFAATPEHRGRPRVLDETKQREICALLSAGCSLRDAARYVGCNRKTIQRETERNEEFRTKLRRAEMSAELTPLRAIQQAAATHWRAAAWMLERTHPERFARRDPKGLGGQDARDLVDGVLTILRTEIRDPLLELRVRERVKAAMEAALHHTWETRRTSTRVRRALEQLEAKERDKGFLDQFGFPTPKLDALLRPPAAQSAATASAPDPSARTAPQATKAATPPTIAAKTQPAPANGKPARPPIANGAPPSSANNVPAATPPGTKFADLHSTLDHNSSKTIVPNRISRIPATPNFGTQKSSSEKWPQNSQNENGFTGSHRGSREESSRPAVQQSSSAAEHKR